MEKKGKKKNEKLNIFTEKENVACIHWKEKRGNNKI